MKKVIQLTLMAVMVFAATETASAQKFGYVNSTDILAELPAMKVAESSLEAMQQQLQKKGQDMVQRFQDDVSALENLAAKGELTPKQQQEESTKLQARQTEIGRFEQSMVNDLQEKRAELLKPIYDSVNEAIKAVALEGGYQFIFDQQVLLYGEEASDVSAAVRAKLGL